MSAGSASVALALLAGLLLAGGVVLANVGLRHLESARGALVSIPSTMVLYWLLAIFMLDMSGWSLAAAAIFLGVGIVFPAVVTLLGFEANRRAGAAVAGTMSSTTPMFATLGAVVFLGEPLTLQAAAGTAAIVLGVVTLSWQGSGPPRRWAAWVVLLPLTGAAIRGGALSVVKAGLALWPNPFAAGMIGYTASALTIVAANRALGARRPGANRRRGIPWFVGVGLCNGLSVLALYSALEGGQVSIVGPVFGAYPVFVLALSVLFLREDVLNARVLTGTGLIMAGVAALATA